MAENQSDKGIIKILEDEPVSSSDFNSHRDIAKAIYNIVINEKVGHRIGLLGSWGSGKSTVIKLLSDKLEEHNAEEKGGNVQIFTFDAWLHESDPIRRSFIEELMEFYHNKKLINKESKENKNIIDKITRRKEDQTVTTTPRIKPEGLIIALTYLVSISIASFLIDGFKEDIASIEYEVVLLCFGLYFWPLLFLFFKDRDDIASIVFNESKKEFQHTIIKTPDPTAIEFHEDFCKILKEAQDSKKKQHKLVIVLDNLDRVSDDDAFKMLTTMRGFFADRKKNNIWVIVPFDVNAIKRMFANEEIYSDESDGVRPYKIIDAAIVDSFIEKTFNIKFHVTPPIITDNEKYFLKKVDEAFSNLIKPNDKKAIFQLYDSEIRSPTENTPRKVITYINNISSMYRLWGEDILVRTQALFCLKREKIGSDLKRSLQGQPAGGVTAQQEVLVNNKEWNKDFAAMFFGVEKERAYHVLAGDELRKGLEEGKDDDEFLELAKIHGFPSILQEVILNLIHSVSNGGTFSRVSYSISLLEERAKEDISFAWNYLSDFSANVENHGDLEDKTKSGLIALISHAGKNRIEQVARNILGPLFILQQGQIKDSHLFRIKIWVDTLKGIHAMLSDHGKEEILTEFSDIKNSKECLYFLVHALKYASKNELKELASLFSEIFYMTGIEGIMFSVLAPDVKDLSQLYEVIKYIEDIDGGSRFETLPNDVFNVVQSQSYDNDISTALKILGVMANGIGCENAQEKIKSLCENGAIYGFLNHSVNESKTEDSGLCMALIIKYHLDPISPRNFGNNQSYINGYAIREGVLGSNPDIDDELLTYTVDALHEYADFRQCVQNIYSDKNNAAFVTKSLVQAIKDHEYKESHDIGEFIGKYDLYSSLLGESHEEIFSDFQMAIISKKGFLEAVLNNGFSGKPSGLFEKALSEDSPVSSDISSYLKNAIESMDSTEWNTSIKEWVEGGDDRLNCLNHLYDCEVEVSLGKDTADSLINNLEGLSKEEDPYREFVSAIPRMLKPQSRKLFSEQLKIKIIQFAKDEETKITNSLIGLFGEQLNKKAMFKDDTDDFLNWIIVPAIDNSLLMTIDWLKENSSKFSSIFNEEQKDLFEERIKKSIAGNKDENVRLALTELAEQYGIDLSEKEEEVEEAKDETMGV
jgi:energy-coupling factor transporter ATP-binding protein EcfA2